MVKIISNDVNEKKVICDIIDLRGGIVMLKYKYSAKQRDGIVIQGEIVAIDTNDFLIKLKDLQLFCLTYSINEEDVEHSTFKVKGKNIVIFSRQLATMLSAGVSVVKAIDILYEKSEVPKMRESLRLLYEDLQQGRDLSSAMSNQGNTYPQLLIKMIRSGEVSGTLDSTLEKMADHYEKENKLMNKVRNASIYPIILAVVSVVIVIALLAFVMPTFLGLYGDQELPLATRILIFISDTITQKWYLLLVTTAVVVVAVSILIRRPKIRFRLDRMKLTMPIFGKLNKTILSARFARTFATLYASGVNILEAMEIISEILGNTYIASKFERVITRVSNGEYISTSIADEDMFESMLTSMIYIGEESGRLDSILEKTADFYDEEAQTATQKMVSLVEPMMIVIMGVVVCFLIVAMILPMYGMLNNVQ